MTPEQNTLAVQRAYAAFKSGDMATLMSTYAEDVTWEVYGPSTIPTAGTRRGLAGVTDFFGILGAAMTPQSFEPHEFVAQGDQVVVLGEYSWTVKATGRSFKANFAHVSTLRDGKIIRFREYTDTAAAVAAFAG